MDLESLTFLAGGVVTVYYGIYSVGLICSKDCSSIPDFTVWKALWGAVAALIVGVVMLSSVGYVWGSQSGLVAFLLGSHQHGAAQVLRLVLSMGLFGGIVAWVYTQVVTPLLSRGCADRPDPNSFVVSLIYGLNKVQPFVWVVAGLYALGFFITLFRYVQGGSPPHGGASPGHSRGPPGHPPAGAVTPHDAYEHLKEHNDRLLKILEQTHQRAQPRSPSRPSPRATAPRATAPRATAPRATAPRPSSSPPVRVRI